MRVQCSVIEIESVCQNGLPEAFRGADQSLSGYASKNMLMRIFLAFVPNVYELAWLLTVFIVESTGLVVFSFSHLFLTHKYFFNLQLTLYYYSIDHCGAVKQVADCEREFYGFESICGRDFFINFLALVRVVIMGDAHFHHLAIYYIWTKRGKQTFIKLDSPYLKHK